MGVVVDTNVFIDAEHGRADLTRISSETQLGDCYLAAMTVSELLAGVHMAKSAQTRMKRSAFVEAVIASVPILDFSVAVARTYGALYGQFLKSRARSQVNVHDLQIAATAIAHGFVLLTRNIGDFRRIPGLTVRQPG